MMGRSGRVRHELRRLQGSGRRDHAPGAVERALAQFEPEQAVALERAGQRQLAGLAAEKPNRV